MSAPVVTELHLKKCRVDCKFYKQASLWEECCTEESQYRDNNGRAQLHTIRHMRTYQCGEEGKLYRKDYAPK